MQQLIFRSNESQNCVTIYATDDAIFENNEQLDLSLSSPVPHSSHSASVTITDNDGRFHISHITAM